MSFSKSINKNSSSVKKPFCKVCQDAGKPESEYTSHFVRSLPDKNGNTTVICPVLAATECRYCHGLGHTTKFCPVIQDNNKREEKRMNAAIQAAKAEQRAHDAARAAAKKSRKPTGAFVVLADDSDDEKQVPNVKISSNEKSPSKDKILDEFPPLVEGLSGASLKPVSSVSWATTIAVSHAAPVYNETPPKVEFKLSSTSKCWADWSDSDTEEEYEASSPKLVRTKSTYPTLSSCGSKFGVPGDDAW